MNMQTETLGRFGHHPDPAADFEIEVDALTGLVWDAEKGMEPRQPVADRIRRAMTFTVGGVPSAVAAKQSLRVLEARFCPYP